MSLSVESEHRLSVLRESISQWAPAIKNPERLLSRENVDVVRAEIAEPVTLEALQNLAKTQAAGISGSELRIERRQRPDPAGEGSLGYYVLLQSQPMTDEQYAAKIEQLWVRRERALLAQRGIDSSQLDLYRRLHAQFGHLELVA